MLEGLIVAGIADPRQHRAHRLARTVAQQPEQVPPERAPLRDMPKRRFERLQPRQQPIDPRGRIRRQHRAAAYRTPAIGTMSSIQITARIRPNHAI